MTPETLRQAAALMRERAEDAGLARWHTPADLLGMFDDPDDGDHIASWHPAVALAVADLLDGIAADFTNDEDYADNDFVSAALAVANAYLSEEA